MSLHDISTTIDRALASAGLDPRSGLLKGISGTIRQALAAAGLQQGAAAASPTHDPTVVDTSVLERQAPWSATERAASNLPAQFLAGSHAGPAGSRHYKLYVPGSVAAAAQNLPLLVMLHGCQQDPDDFATGTRMNELAEQHRCLVVYPAQSARANGSNCWNWFKTEDQARDGGEPELIAGIVRDVMASYPVDAQRVFVAGLSAGAAMAVILGRTHPELFAAVGAHSGLPFGAAHDVASAFAAMRSGAGPSERRASAQHGATRHGWAPVPTIVFHGDRDHTVSSSNGEAIVRQALADADRHLRGPLYESAATLAVAGGRRYTTTVYADADGQAWVERWLVHDAAHAWAGGSTEGSFTDPLGPDASAQMLRFFLGQPTRRRSTP